MRAPVAIHQKRRDAPEATLAAVLAEIRALTAKVDTLLERTGELAQRDRERLAPLLPAVFTLLGDKVWTVAILVHLAAADDALAAALAPFLGGLRGLGKLLRRAQGISIGGYVVERVGDDRGGALWRVSAPTETRETRTARSVL